MLKAIRRAIVRTLIWLSGCVASALTVLELSLRVDHESPAAVQEMEAIRLAVTLVTIAYGGLMCLIFSPEKQ